MITLLTRRAGAQWPLLFSLLSVLATAATLLGTAALLVTSTSERAVEVAAARADPDDVAVTAYTVTVAAGNARSVTADIRKVLTEAIAPFSATTVTRASSVMRKLPIASDEKNGLTAEAYLSGIDDIRARAGLVAGRWPRATADSGSSGSRTPMEAVLFDNTARLIGVTVGSRVHLGEELARDPAPPLDVVVVGLIRANADAGWDRDPLDGRGFDPNPPDSTMARKVNAYGPFVVDVGDMLAGGSNMDRIEVNARPALGDPTGRDLDRLTGALLSADRRLAGTLGDRVRIERVSSPLPQTLIDARYQQRIISGEVLALALIGLVLTGIALALAGRLTAGVRADENQLFTALGAGRGQFALAAIAEIAVLAATALALAVPASSALHSALTHVPPLFDAGLATPFTVNGAQVLAIAGGVLTLVVLHIGLALQPIVAPGDRRPRRDLLARSGADLVLVLLAAVGWWQLRAQPAAAGSRADAVRLLAPALLLTAGTALALRLVPPALRWAERLAARGRGLVLPLTAFQAARRPQATAAGLLIGLGCAAATFGTAFSATWHVSQHDQADLSVGTDLAIALAGPPVTGQSAIVQQATGGTLSPVAQHPIAVGQWLGENGATPQLVAVDTRNAAGLLRGRTDNGQSWAGITRPLTPPTTVTGIPLAAGRPVLTGTATGKSNVYVTPALLLQDATGLRTTCTGTIMLLNGKPHPLPPCSTGAGLRLVAVALPLSGDFYDSDLLNTTIDVTLALPGTAPPKPAKPWTADAASPEADQLTSPTVTISGNKVRMTAAVQFADPSDITRVLVASAFGKPGAVPVAVSARFASAVNAHPGSKLSVTFGDRPVDVVVTAIVPNIPSAPGAAAVLADVDALTRALALKGDLFSPITAWWAGDPGPDAAARATGLHLGEVRTRAGETERLTGSPLRAALPAVLRVLIAAAVLLLLGGVILHVACDVQLRALEVARLRALGMSRRDIRRTLLGEHAAVLMPLMAAGAVIGAAATWAVAPLLIRSDTGAAPQPPAAAHWPWAAEGLLLALLVLVAGLTVAAVVTVQARKADAAHLRVAS